MTEAYRHETTKAIEQELRILGYHYGTPEWDGALAAARARMRKLEAAVEAPDVTVKVSRELLAELGNWSDPVQIMVEHVGGEYTMVARRHDCPIREAYDPPRRRGGRRTDPRRDGSMSR